MKLTCSQFAPDTDEENSMKPAIYIPPRTATMLELRGALDLLSAAKKTIRMSGWEGCSYHHATKAEQEAYSLLMGCWFAVNKDLKAMLGQNKEFTQAAALGRL